MTSSAHRCDLILALIDACLKETDGDGPHDPDGPIGGPTGTPAADAPGHRYSALPGGATRARAEDGVASGRAVRAS